MVCGTVTATPGSLRAQCLTRILSSERPDICTRQAEYLRDRARFAVELRQLEDALLTALTDSRSKGSILENDEVSIVWYFEEGGVVL